MCTDDEECPYSNQMEDMWVAPMYVCMYVFKVGYSEITG
jgi:hypothetical protein